MQALAITRSQTCDLCMAKSRDLDLSRDQTVEGVETCSQCITSLHSPDHVRTLFLNILISSAIRQVSGCPLERTEIYVWKNTAGCKIYPCCVSKRCFKATSDVEVAAMREERDAGVQMLWYSGLRDVTTRCPGMLSTATTFARCTDYRSTWTRPLPPPVIA